MEASDTIDELVYPCGDPPDSGSIRAVAPGVMWIRMRLSGSSLGAINLWALEDRGGWTLVDTGIHTPGVARDWETLLSGPLGGRPVRRVLVTHLHADHVGMAGWLTRRTGARLWMTRLEYLSAQASANAGTSTLSMEAMAFYRRAGWGADAIAAHAASYGRNQSLVFPLPGSFRRISDDETLSIGGRPWRVVVGSGHCPEHACLFCDGLNLLISGDQVLPRISSNVSVQPSEPEADPLAEWLASLRKLRREVPRDVLVLPAHNEPFSGLHGRLAALEAGIQRKLDTLRRALMAPRRAVDVFAALFSAPVSPDELSRYCLATGEAMAYLSYLLYRGEIAAQEDADGVAWYREP